MSTASAASRRAILALALGLAPCLGACICPPEASELARAGKRSPEQAFESFQAYMRADLLEEEYRAFSTRFTAENQLSFTTYAEGRERLFAEKPWLKLLVRAEVVGGRRVAEGVHELDVRVAGRTFRVRMAREDFFEIRAGERLLADGEAPFGRLVRVRPLPAPEEGSRVAATVAVELAPEELEAMSELLVAREWKIDAFAELGEDEPPLPAP
jgi:hypothetical protein